MKKVTKVWTTGNGEKVRICDMSDRHLLNAIAYCERAHSKAQREMEPPMFQGEMAQFFADQAYDEYQEDGPERSFPLYLDLHDEAERRGLKKLEDRFGEQL